jgi:glycosyltransferase involved in cell wall biosynthesis
MATRVLIVSAEHVGAQMAGPAIRALELARALAGSCRVTLAAPAPSEVDDPRIKLVRAGFEDYGPLRDAIAGAEVVVAQQLPTRLLGQLAGTDVRLVADLYNPSPVEVLEYSRDQDPGVRRRLQRLVAWRAIAHAGAADFILCASERQRDLWLGTLAGAGLLSLSDYDADPSLRRVIDVVPFGLPTEPPRPGPPAMKGVWPGIETDARVLLWGGGVWNWLDPLTAIDAARRLADARPAVHLVFLGMKRPSIEPGHASAAAARARSAARELGLDGHRVHFHEDWVPYRERGRWLLEADLGVSAHLDHLESRFSFRTRVLDCLWASLPVVCTSGDALGDLVQRRGLGLTVAAGDGAGFAAACSALLDDDERRDRIRRAASETAAELTWPRVAEPLIGYCERAPDLPPRARHRRKVTLATVAQYPDMLGESYGQGGARRVAGRLARNLSRRLGRDA